MQRTKAKKDVNKIMSDNFKRSDKEKLTDW